ncbi:MAG: DUF4339 domain-containing protein [Isosphaeraceae bacterium]
MSAQYYLMINGTKQGPFPRRDLASRGLRADTLVWTEGASEGTRADQIADLTDLLAEPSSRRRRGHGVQPGRLRNLWRAFAILATIMVLMMSANGITHDVAGENLQSVWEYWGVKVVPVLLIALVVIGLYAALLYRCWDFLQDGPARTSPGRAVGFLFLPVFNFYWNFEAIGGLAADVRADANRRQVSAEWVSEGLALTYCVFYCALPAAYFMGWPAAFLLTALLAAAQVVFLGSVVGVIERSVSRESRSSRKG